VDPPPRTNFLHFVMSALFALRNHPMLSGPVSQRAIDDVTEFVEVIPL
jgi:hypothetical protein